MPSAAMILPRGGAAAPFAPNQLANVIAWFKADSGVTLTTGRISALADLKGVGNDLAQGTAGDRPVIAAAARNSRDVIRHNGDWLTRAAYVGGQVGNLSYIWFHKQSAVNYGVDAGGSTPGGQQKAVLYGGGTSDIQITAGTPVEPDTSWTLPVRWAMDVVVFKGATSVYHRDGYKVNQFNPGSGNSDGLTLGASYLGGFPGDGDTGELVVVAGDVTADPLFAQLAPYGWQSWRTPQFVQVYANQYEDFPGLVKLQNGDLYGVWRSATGHLGPDGVIKASRSTNNGDSWSAATTIYSEPSANLQQDNTIVQLANGNILIGFWTSQTSDGNPLVAKVLRSTDNGATWSLYASSVPIPSGYDWVVFYGRMVELSAGGRILATMYGLTSGRFDALLFYSDDGGATWAKLSTAATGNIVGNLVWTEWCLIPQTTAGHLLGVVRNDSGSTLSQITSTDSGATWSAPSSLFGGVSPDLLRLADGRILLSYAERQGGPNAGNRYRTSSNEGSTWGSPQTIYVAYSPDVGHGYPSAQQLADGSVCWLSGDRVPTIIFQRMLGADV